MPSSVLLAATSISNSNSSNSNNSSSNSISNIISPKPIQSTALRSHQQFHQSKSFSTAVTRDPIPDFPLSTSLPQVADCAASSTVAAVPAGSTFVISSAATLPTSNTGSRNGIHPNSTNTNTTNSETSNNSNDRRSNPSPGGSLTGASYNNTSEEVEVEAEAKAEKQSDISLKPASTVPSNFGNIGALSTPSAAASAAASASNTVCAVRKRADSAAALSGSHHHHHRFLHQHTQSLPFGSYQNLNFSAAASFSSSSASGVHAHSSPPLAELSAPTATATAATTPSVKPRLSFSSSLTPPSQLQPPSSSSSSSSSQVLYHSLFHNTISTLLPPPTFCATTDRPPLAHTPRSSSTPFSAALVLPVHMPSQSPLPATVAASNSIPTQRTGHQFFQQQQQPLQKSSASHVAHATAGSPVHVALRESSSASAARWSMPTTPTAIGSSGNSGSINGLGLHGMRVTGNGSIIRPSSGHYPSVGSQLASISECQSNTSSVDDSAAASATASTSSSCHIDRMRSEELAAALEQAKLSAQPEVYSPPPAAVEHVPILKHHPEEAGAVLDMVKKGHRLFHFTRSHSASSPTTPAFDDSSKLSDYFAHPHSQVIDEVSLPQAAASPSLAEQPEQCNAVFPAGYNSNVHIIDNMNMLTPPRSTGYSSVISRWDDLDLLYSPLPSDITLEDEEALMLPPEEVEASVYDLIEDISDHSLPWVVKLGEAVRVIERTVRMFGENAIALGFNGGKDCTILVHLYVAVLSRLRRRGDIPSPPEGTKQPRILCFYVSSPRSFEKADIFVKSCRYLYNLNVVSISEPIKSATQRFCRAHPHIRSIIMGVRRDDPHGKLLQAFSPCDKDWAENVIRVSPILDMSFEEVWESTHACGIPICPLYYDGYTSLGYKDNTTKNDALLDRTNGEWLPGWYLLDGTLERMNRAYTPSQTPRTLGPNGLYGYPSPLLLAISRSSSSQGNGLISRTPSIPQLNKVYARAKNGLNSNSNNSSPSASGSRTPTVPSKGLDSNSSSATNSTDTNPTSSNSNNNSNSNNTSTN